MDKRTSHVEGPKVSRIREYMSARFPEQTYAAEDEMEDALLEHLRTSDEKLAGNEATNKTIMEVIAVYPEFAQIIEDVAAGMPPSAAIARQFTPEELTATKGEPDYDAYRKAAKERTERLAENRRRVESREQNMARSKVDVDDFFAAQGMDEEEQKRFVDWVDNEILANLLDGKVNKTILTKLYQGWKYDEAVAEARDAGKVEGRNEQIERRRATSDKTDGLPSDGGAVTIHQTKEAPDIFDEVLSRRNKRKF